ncbi:Hypothetical predicted protein [Paramuricea clavata]|uniref:Uncharacterized protein n=1 Tax=Paramuricea clavata TaxID=317549 RepID=A0A7D9I1P2_PARCT|nr:Hypothetical predicted protein [Paramuricea clavata]
MLVLAMLKRGAKGHLETLKEGATDTIGLKKVLTISNHMTMDGENKNVGEHNGLWKLIDDERTKEEVTFQMLKSVCAVHSSALAYHDLCKDVSEVNTLIRKVSGISLFFHASAVRTAELEKYAKRARHQQESKTVRHFISEKQSCVKDSPKADRQAWFQKVFQRDYTDESDVEDANNVTKQKKIES